MTWAEKIFAGIGLRPPSTAAGYCIPDVERSTPEQLAAALRVTADRFRDQARTARGAERTANRELRRRCEELAGEIEQFLDASRASST